MIPILFLSATSVCSSITVIGMPAFLTPMASAGRRAWASRSRPLGTLGPTPPRRAMPTKVHCAFVILSMTCGWFYSYTVCAFSQWVAMLSSMMSLRCPALPTLLLSPSSLSVVVAMRSLSQLLRRLWRCCSASLATSLSKLFLSLSGSENETKKRFGPPSFLPFQYILEEHIYQTIAISHSNCETWFAMSNMYAFPGTRSFVLSSDRTHHAN